MDILERINYYLQEQDRDREAEVERERRKKEKEREKRQARAVRRRIEQMRDRIEAQHDAAARRGLPGFHGA